MTCAYCDAKISKDDVAAGRYIFSRFTGNHYCLNSKRHAEVAAKLRRERAASA